MQQFNVRSLAGKRVQRPEGFVHQHHLSVVNKRLRDCRLLMHSARQLLRVTAFEAVGSDQREKIPGPKPVAGHLFFTSRGFSQQDTLV